MNMPGPLGQDDGLIVPPIPKAEKINDLGFGIENLVIMKLYNEILLNYLDENKLKEQTHNEVIKQIISDILEKSHIYNSQSNSKF